MKEKMTGKMMVTTQLMVTVLLMQLMVMVSEISTAEMMTEPISAIAKEEWELFKLKHNKTYGDINEETVRMNIFMENKLQVIEHNKLYEQNLTTFQMDTNHLSDMLVHEVVAVLNGYRGERDESQGSVYIPPEDDFIKLPRSIDWRTRNTVTRVKHQGQCGSGWAFAATGALEGQHARKTGYLINLSEQDLVDCCRLCHGCQGGLMTLAYRCIFMDGGINSEFDYPYIARDSMCKYSRNMAVATVTGYAKIASGNESALMNAVALVGPVAVGIDAGHTSFQHYRSGVYYEPHCSSTHLNHGVLVVGYGTYRGVDYWLVKNSWTTNWGDQGYIKIARNRRNMCGIATAASFPFV